MIIEIFEAEGDAENPLSEQLFERMISLLRIAKIVEAFSEPPYEAESLTVFPQL